MKLGRLVAREIFHRKLNFSLSLLGAAVAVVSVLATLALLRAHDAQTGEILSKMEESTSTEMAKLQDEIRKSMKGLGFNIYIFPEEQNLSEVYEKGYASKTMPEGYVTKLAESKIVTVNHLLPSLTRQLIWPEKKRTVVLIGIRGEVPLAHRDPKSPLIDPVSEGELVLGYELHNSLELQEGDKVVFKGRDFIISKTHPPRGSVDDITIWMNLTECQDLLGVGRHINAIQALECNCSTVDRLGEIRAELLEILPGTQIIETGSTALARAEARNTAAATARKQIATTRDERANLKRERENFASFLLPFAVVLSMVWIAILTFTNVRERLGEIGILRAIGVKSHTILAAFLGRAVLAGLTGAALGAVITLALGPLLRDSILHGATPTDLIRTTEWIAVVAAAPLLACLASWIPAFSASQRDPADVLRND